MPHQRRRIATVGLVAASLALIGLVNLPSAEFSSQAAPVQPGTYPSIVPTSQASVAQTYNDWYYRLVEQHRAASTGSTAATASCIPGVTSDASRQRTLDAVNYFRAMTGVSTVTENAGFTIEAQAAAMMMAANNDIQHEPPSSWKCRTANALNGAMNSNLAMGATGPLAIASYMRDDSSADNLARAGHRRTIIDSRQLQMGFGDAGSFNATRIGTNLPSSLANLTQPWPSAGFFPAELIATTTDGTKSTAPWSLSIGPGTFSNPSVTMKRNGSTIPVIVKTPSYNTGPNSLVWEVNGGLTLPVGLAKDIYDITVSGIADSPTYTYQVTLFNARPTVTAKSVSYSTSDPDSLYRRLSVTPTNWLPLGQVTHSYQWYRGSNPISGETTNSYQGRFEDLDQQVWVRVTGSAAGWFSASMDIKSFPIISELPIVQIGSPGISRTLLNGFLAIGYPQVITGVDTVPKDAQVSYRWSRSDGSVVGLSDRYTITAADACFDISVTITASRTGWQTGTKKTLIGSVGPSAGQLVCPTPTPTNSTSPTPTTSRTAVSPAPTAPAAKEASPSSHMQRPPVVTTTRPGSKNHTIIPKVSKKVRGQAGKTRLKVSRLNQLQGRKLVLQRWSPTKSRWVNTKIRRTVSAKAAARGYLKLTLPKVPGKKAKFRIKVKATAAAMSATSRPINWTRR